MMCQIFSIGEISGLQAGQFSTRTLLLRSHAVVAAVCGFALSCWNTRRLEGSMCCSITFIYLSAFIVPSKTCKLPMTYALMHPHTVRDAGFELNADNTLAVVVKVHRSSTWVKVQIRILKYYSSKSKSTAFSILLEWKYKSTQFFMYLSKKVLIDRFILQFYIDYFI